MIVCPRLSQKRKRKQARKHRLRGKRVGESEQVLQQAWAAQIGSFFEELEAPPLHRLWANECVSDTRQEGLWLGELALKAWSWRGAGRYFSELKQSGKAAHINDDTLT